jgi:hypothetical protein
VEITPVASPQSFESIIDLPPKFVPVLMLVELTEIGKVAA